MIHITKILSKFTPKKFNEFDPTRLTIKGKFFCNIDDARPRVQLKIEFDFDEEFVTPVHRGISLLLDLLN